MNCISSVDLDLIKVFIICYYTGYWLLHCCLYSLLNSLHAGNFIFWPSTDFLQKFLSGITSVLVLDPAQASHSVGPDLGPSCLQTLSADKG